MRLLRASSIAWTTGFALALRVFLQDGRDLFEPPVRRALGVANADFGVLVCAPDDPVAADVVEEEETGEEASTCRLR